MANTSSLVFAGIAPHPPIMVPEVGREAIADVRNSIDAMAALTERVIASGAETVVLISPHAPLEPDAFVAFDGPQLYADFANFRAPTATVHAELDEELLKEITRAAAEAAFDVVRIRGDLDHGTAVPLYFLQRDGWHGRVVALGYSFLSNDDHLRFGNCIRAAVDRVGRPVAFIASGDLSHRLKPDAPAGYNPQAHLFDEEVVDAIRSNSMRSIANIDQELRRMAGECGYRSMLVAIGVAQGLESIWSRNLLVAARHLRPRSGRLRIAQRFSAGIGSPNLRQSPRSGRQIKFLTRLLPQAVPCPHSPARSSRPS